MQCSDSQMALTYGRDRCDYFSEFKLVENCGGAACSSGALTRDR